MEGEPNTENVHYIDEYPHLERRITLRRMGQLSLVPESGAQLVLFPVEGDGDGEWGA